MSIQQLYVFDVPNETAAHSGEEALFWLATEWASAPASSAEFPYILENILCVSPFTTLNLF